MSHHRFSFPGNMFCPSIYLERILPFYLGRTSLTVSKSHFPASTRKPKILIFTQESYGKTGQHKKATPRYKMSYGKRRAPQIFLKLSLYPIQIMAQLSTFSNYILNSSIIKYRVLRIHEKNTTVFPIGFYVKMRIFRF